MTDLARPLERPSSRIGRVRRAMRLVLVNGIGASYAIPKRMRLSLYRACGYTIAPCTIFAHTIIRSEHLTVGAGSFINHFCLFGDGEISLGRSVFIGPHVTLASSDHRLGTSAKRAGADIALPITIEEGVWIGAGAVILGGVTVGRGCVVGAGAVVTQSTEPNGVYLGIPARRVRELGE